MVALLPGLNDIVLSDLMSSSVSEAFSMLSANFAEKLSCRAKVSSSVTSASPTECDS